MIDERRGAVATLVSECRYLAARLCAAQLDRELASGVPCDSSPMLLTRAAVLVRPDTRRDLRRSLVRIVTASSSHSAPRPPGLPALNRRGIADAADELILVIERLAAPGPVGLRGIARVAVLLRDGCGPLYSRSSGEELREHAHRIVIALDPWSEG